MGALGVEGDQLNQQLIYYPFTPNLAKGQVAPRVSRQHSSIQLVVQVFEHADHSLGVGRCSLNSSRNVVAASLLLSSCVPQNSKCAKNAWRLVVKTLKAKVLTRHHSTKLERSVIFHPTKTVSFCRSVVWCLSSRDERSNYEQPSSIEELGELVFVENL